MKSFYTLVLFLSLATALGAQQEEQFTQFMNYKLGFNPGAAGSEETTVLTALVRSQWLGLEGAPETQVLTFNMPVFNQRVGLGGSLLRQTIGLSETFELNGSYAYRINFARGYLGMGLQGSLRLLTVDFSEAQAVQPVETDEAIPVGYQSKFVPNFGAGLYYVDQFGRFYLGFSIPRLLENNIDLADSEDVISREIRHFYIMGGVKIGFGENFIMQPQVLLKSVRGAPFDMDINLNLHLAGKFTTGLSYRIGGSKSNSLGESLALLLGMDISRNLTFGLSYDMTLSQLRNYNNGSVEGMLTYRFAGKQEETLNGFFDGRRFFDRE